MYKALSILVLLASALAQQQGSTNNGDLDTIIQQIFGTPGGDGQNQNTGATGQNSAGNAVNTGGNGQQGVGGTPDRSPSPNAGALTGPSTIVPPPGLSDATNDTSCTTENNEEGECMRYYLCNSNNCIITTNDTSCTTENNEVGECVRYYLCNSNNSIITDGVGIIDIRVRDGPCPSYLDTCCLLPDTRPPTDPITPPPPVQPTEQQGCGWRNPEGVGFRITGATEEEAKFGEFPWMVAILKIQPVNENDPSGQKLNVYVGGGSLIHPSVVLTTAHYVAGSGELRVRAGEWDTQTTKEIHPYQDRDVEKVVVHKDFNKGNLFYDIALLFLSRPMDLAPNVGTACLPPPRERVPGGTRCFASGWGKDKFGKEGRYQVILKKVEVPVVERRQCQEALRRTRLGRYFELHSSFMCAGGQGQDTCKGDGGSPLVCPIQYEQNRYVQNGIVAWGIGCGEDGTPGVYVDVANLRDWIDDKVRGQGYNASFYTY